MRAPAPLAFLLVGALCACSDSDAPNDAGGPDAGPVADAGDSGAPDTGEPPRDAGPPPDSGADDGNDGFDEAADARKNTDNGASGAIAWPGDRDYFVFEGAEGEFVSVFTVSRPRPTGVQVDTVIRLYDAAMTQVAENDDSVPRVDVNSEVIYRLPADGRYFVEVLEWSDWASETPQGSDEFTYTLLVRTVNDLNPGITLETESGDDAASAIDVELVRGAGLVCGTFDDASDVDVFAISQSLEDRFVFVPTMPSGPMGYGSTSPVGRVWLTDATGQDTIARLELSETVTSFSPAAPPGDYLLWLEHPGTAAGANDFYVFKPFVLPDNDPEAEPNDSRPFAEARVLVLREQQMDRASFVLSTLPDGDVDFFSIRPASNEHVTVVCGARSVGSGVQDLRVELQDASGQTIASATETATEPARIEDQVVTSSTAYVRLSKGGQDPAVSGAYVRCGFFATIAE